ncbi:MAG: aminotransferase class III-fold pyridoxal phosphate-dependent enzyme [Pseudomonadota bacterium]
MTCIAIVQARMGSTRLPDKVMLPVGGVPMIELLLSRLSRARRVDSIVLATSTDPRNDPLARHVRSLGYEVYHGSEGDVLDRYYRAAEGHSPEIVIRITGDCPLVDPLLVDQVVDAFSQSGVDYLSNTNPPTYPDGLDIEVFTFAALRRAWKEATLSYDREHVTPYMKEPGRFRVGNAPGSEDLSDERWTVDEPADYEVILNICRHFAPRTDFSWQEVMALRRQKPELFMPNLTIQRNEGARMGTGQKLWKRAKRVIPGGNMLLSKRAEMFAPDQWPAYYSKSSDCRVWDLDGREFIDMSMMGIGTNTLGYAHPEVDDAVRAVVSAGNLTTLNAPEEVYLAERLVEMHPWADMVRFARSGGEANAVSIRIARAAAGRTQVAICGYHGWHDWYLAANLGDADHLTGHLLPGLEANGVPLDLRGSVHTFRYNHFEELQALVDSHPIGVIKMEVSRNHEPADDFLGKIRRLATERGIVLVFDECTSGFRQTFGGLHKQYGVEPDMATFGKTLGNGYAVTAVLGRREIMEAAQTTFISSSFWTERIGSAAALKTLEVMERVESWETITRLGKSVIAGWKDLAARHGLDIQVSGLPALASFSFAGPQALAFKTLMVQEMLEKGYLAGPGFYASTAHTPAIISAYLDALDPVFALVRKCQDGMDVKGLLKGPVCHDGFKRLN